MHNHPIMMGGKYADPKVLPHLILKTKEQIAEQEKDGTKKLTATLLLSAKDKATEDEVIKQVTSVDYSPIVVMIFREMEEI